MGTMNGGLRWMAAGSLLMGVTVAFAADGGAVQKIGHGQINWTEQYVEATGSGAPDPKAANVAVARLGAERAAKLDAQRNLLETLKGANVTAKATAADEMSSNGSIKSKVEGVIRNFKVVDTRYYSDGSVDVVVRANLKGDLADALLPDADAKAMAAVPAVGESKLSGLIINAKGLQAVPAMAPRILDEDGKEVYGVTTVADASAKENGIAGYVKDLESAQGHNRVKGSPLVLRAVKLATPGKSDLVISNADAEKLRDKNSNMSFLTQGKVIIVID